MRHALVLLVSCLIAATAFAAEEKPRQVAEKDKTVYALGVMVGRSLEGFALTPQELEVLKGGIEDAMLKKSALADVDAYRPQVQALQRERAAKLAAGEKEAGAAFLAKAAAEKGAKKTASGIVVSTLKAGTGPKPTAKDRVSVHYEGKLIDGKVFDSSIARGEPATFPLDGVIPCWTEALQLMQVGGKS